MCVRSYSRYVLALHLQAGFKPASSTWSIEIYGQTLILHHHHCCRRCSLVPRPHLWGGNRVWWLWAKSLVQLTTHGGICTSQSDCSFSPVIWLASCRNVTGPLPTIQIWIAYTTLLTNQIQALFKCTHVGAHAQSQPNQENGPKSPDPFPSSRVGSGDRLRKCCALLATPINSTHCRPAHAHNLAQCIGKGRQLHPRACCCSFHLFANRCRCRCNAHCVCALESSNCLLYCNCLNT